MTLSPETVNEGNSDARGTTPVRVSFLSPGNPGAPVRSLDVRHCDGRRNVHGVMVLQVARTG